MDTGPAMTAVDLYPQNQAMRIYQPTTVVEAARTRLRWVFSEFENVVVCVSGGKDSSVLAYLALQVAREMKRLPLNLFFLDQEAEWQVVIDHIRRMMHQPDVRPIWYQVPFRMSNSTSTVEQWLHCWEPTEEEHWMRPQEPDSIHVNPTGEDRFRQMFWGMLRAEFGDNKACSISGVRAEESPTRRMGLTWHPSYKWVTWGTEEPKKKRPHYVFYPLYDFTLTDVWKTINELQIPYCELYCTPAETPIWMGDYSFKRIEQVRPGDTVFGFTPVVEGTKSRLRATLVEAVTSRRADVVKITLASGRTVRCTPDHRWLRTSHGRTNWHLGPVKVGDYMGFVVTPDTAPLTTDGAWLGGLWDGEGHTARASVSLSQSERVNPLVCERIRRVFATIEVPFAEKHGTNAMIWQVRGGRDSIVRFICRTRPTQLPKLERAVQGGRFRVKDRVVAIEPDGHEMVYALQTTVGSYVAWGYASSNSLMYQHGIPDWSMRVSNVHHETSLGALFFLQELEPKTWERLTQRLQGIDMTGKLGLDYWPTSLPPMFGSWYEYRDYLLEHLVTVPEWQAKMRKRFRFMKKWEDKLTEKQIAGVQIKAILSNDHEMVKVDNWEAQMGKRMRVRENPW